MRINELKKVSVGRKELAALLGYSENHINYLVANHGAPKNKEHNSYPLFEFIIWHVGYLQKSKEEEIKKIKSEKPQDLVAERNARWKELMIKQKEGELVSAIEVNDAWQNTMQIIVTEIDAFPIKAVPELTGITDLKEMKIKLEEQVNKLKNRIAQQQLHSDTESIDSK